ncbi:MAG: hypothetical protein CVV44_04430 [Spirochaetae bacterium HGW-Spirochaetae-1]|jgi:hypothetical protein|nr:MAG: hypothetical protein CVV44_04430 [Spirochaetae bacterium HGW-Spirochaetae-1]
MIVLLTACKTPPGIDGQGGDIIQPGAYNVKFIALDRSITDPAMDRRTYYKVFIDKVESGRTTTGLESQEKSFETTLSSNRHLLMVEKWILDEKKGQYIKLNNIEQPKPNYIYFSASANRIITIVMETDSEGKARFIVDFGN